MAVFRSTRLLAIGLALIGGAQGQKPLAPWEAEIAAFEARDRETRPAKGAVLFLGSSSIGGWSTLVTDFPEQRVLNRGFGGSQIADSTHFAARIIFPYQPRMIVLYAGGNDIAVGKPAEEVFADFRKFVATVRARLPKVTIAYISIAGNPARWAQVEKVKAANELIAGFAKETPKTKFIDVFSAMLGEDGLPRPEIFSDDGLHMNAEGYRLWTKIVAPYLRTPAPAVKARQRSKKARRS